MGKKTKSFFLKLLSSKELESCKRFVTLIVSAVFILTCFTVLILLIVLFISTARLQNINIEALKIVGDLLKELFHHEMLIIIGGLGFTTASDYARILTAKYSANPSFTDPSQQSTPGLNPGVDNPDKND